jgi:hypothetical protein
MSYIWAAGFLLAVFVCVTVGRRMEACSRRIDGMLADGDRAARISDEAENGWAR